MNFAFLKSRAKSKLNGNWEQAIIAMLISFVVFIIVDYLFGDDYFFDNFSVFLLRMLVQAPVILGVCSVFLSISRDMHPSGSDIFNGFKHWWMAFKLQFLMIMAIAVGFVLLIVPGIIAALSFSMSFYILADDPHMGARQAMRQSSLMMKGHRMELLILCLSFIGWFFLSALSAGILYVLYVGPYFQATIAEFYESLQEISDY